MAANWHENHRRSSLKFHQDRTDDLHLCLSLTGPCTASKYDSMSAHMFLSARCMGNRRSAWLPWLPNLPDNDDRIKTLEEGFAPRTANEAPRCSHSIPTTLSFEDVPIWIAYASFSSLANVILAQDELFEIKTVAERLSRVY